MGEAAHREVMRRPFADAGQRGPHAHEFGERPVGAEIDVAVAHRRGDRAQSGNTRAGDAEAAQVGVGESGRRGEQIHALAARRHRLMAEFAHDALGQRARCGNGDLLAEHGADGNLETVPAAGQALARMARDARLEVAPAAEMCVDRRDVGVEIEHAAHACDDVGKLRLVGEIDAQVERRITGRGDAEFADAAIEGE